MTQNLNSYKYSGAKKSILKTIFYGKNKRKRINNTTEILEKDIFNIRKKLFLKRVKYTAVYMLIFCFLIYTVTLNVIAYKYIKLKESYNTALQEEVEERLIPIEAKLEVVQNKLEELDSHAYHIVYLEKMHKLKKAVEKAKKQGKTGKINIKY